MINIGMMLAAKNRNRLCSLPSGAAFVILIFLGCAHATASPAFNNPQSVADAVPMDVELTTGGMVNEAGLKQANKAIAAAAKNCSVTFQVSIESVEACHKDGSAFRIRVPNDTVKVVGCEIPCHVWAYFCRIRASPILRFILGRRLPSRAHLPGRIFLRLVASRRSTWTCTTPRLKA